MFLHKLNNLSLALMVATIPLSRLYNINSYSIALFLVLTILNYRKKIFIIPNQTTILYYILFLVVLLNLIAIEQPKVDSTIIKYLPLVLLPFLSQFITNRKIVLTAFLYSVAICCLICIIYAFIQSKGYIFYYHEPTAILDIQLNYLSVFTCFCLAILYNKILCTGTIRIESYLLIVLFLFSLSVFYNITGILISIFITLLFLVVFVLKFKNYKLLAVLLTIVCGGSIWMISRPIIRAKLDQVISVNNYKMTEHGNGVSSRILTWDCSLNLIYDSGLVGLGINNTTDFLNECYRGKVGANSVQTVEHYNSHNQFFETTLGMGFLGLILLLLIYYKVLIVGLKQKNYLIISYFVIILFFGATESFLIRQWGLIFFSFFTPYLIERHPKDKLFI